MLDLPYWWVFIAAALIHNISPGSVLLFVLSRTLANGRRVGIASACGVCSGALVHVLQLRWASLRFWRRPHWPSL